MLFFFITLVRIPSGINTLKLRESSLTVGLVATYSLIRISPIKLLLSKVKAFLLNGMAQTIILNIGI
jgi:hypothetical protein